MSAHSKVRQSRARWKSKAGHRADDNRYLRKELARVKQERERFKQEAKEAKAQLKQREAQAGTPVVRGKGDVVLIALQLFLMARIGFRAVSRVLGVLGHHLGLAHAPCAQSIINWVTRLSITRIQHAPYGVGTPVRGERFSNGFIWMIDTRITLGAGKILGVLALNAGHHHINAGAPSLQSVHCVAVAVAISWTGEAMADFLQRVIAVLGRPVGFLKDGGTDLGKAVRLLSERGFPSPSIADLSHVIANLFKHNYGNHPLFDTFLSACGKVSQKLKQTLLACLAPPRVSTKARFMNLHRLVGWAERLLQHSPRGRAASGSLLAKRRASLDQLPSCKAFIRRFLRDTTPLLECQKLLKVKGLSHDTRQACEALIEVIPSGSPVRIGFMNWIKDQLQVAETLGLAETGLPISSDPIESLFGVAKRHGVGETKDANHIAVHLPAFCGQLTEQDAQRVLEVSVAQQEKVMGPLTSLTKQRREVLPNPGCLENLTPGNADHHLELIPGAENRSKNPIILNISDHYKKSNGPVINVEKTAISPPRGHPSGPSRAG
ncbi:MAG: hypothetical protein WA970_17205 [Gammaproteobacteria bacterium]